MKDFLNLAQRKEFRRAHKKERSRRNADRIKSILLLDSGWTYEQVAEVLLLDDQTIRNYEATYLSKGIDGLLSDNYRGCAAKLTIKKSRYKNISEAISIVRQKRLWSMSEKPLG